MERTAAEAKVLNMFGVDDFRSISKDMLMKAYASKQLNPEVLKVLIGNLPNFINSSLNVVNETLKMMGSTMEQDANDENALIDSVTSFRESLILLKSSEELTFEQSMSVNNLIVSLFNLESNYKNNAADRRERNTTKWLQFAIETLTLIGAIIGVTAYVNKKDN